MSTATLTDTPRPAPGRVVIVDDNPDDIFILQRQLRRLGVSCPITAFQDGHDAMEFLRKTAETQGRAALPELLFLDIHMPGTTGFSVLCWLREHEATHAIKIVILSGTSDPGDVALATALSANAYLTKHSALSGLANVVNRFIPHLLPAPAPVDSANPFTNLHVVPADERLLNAS
ncbi:MAG: response regulator [Verrucomicrobiota bacterium]